MLPQFVKTDLCTVLLPQFMPFILWLVESDDQDTREKNLNRFYFWCATRVLTIKRESAKEYLLSHGIRHVKTDKQRMEAVLCCHGLCLEDSFWIREAGENVSYDQINLFDNLAPGEYVDVVLRDRDMIAKNTGLIPDGCNISAEHMNPNV